jgi:hypothetical protein
MHTNLGRVVVVAEGPRKLVCQAWRIVAAQARRRATPKLAVSRDCTTPSRTELRKKARVTRGEMRTEKTVAALFSASLCKTDRVNCSYEHVLHFMRQKNCAAEPLAQRRGVLPVPLFKASLRVSQRRLEDSRLTSVATEACTSSTRCIAGRTTGCKS